jgi:hypothetical protein
MKIGRGALLGVLIGLVVLGFAILAGVLDGEARWGGYLSALQYGPLLILFLLGSAVTPRSRRRSRM